MNQINDDPVAKFIDAIDKVSVSFMNERMENLVPLAAKAVACKDTEKKSRHTRENGPIHMRINVPLDTDAGKSLTLVSTSTIIILEVTARMSTSWDRLKAWLGIHRSAPFLEHVSQG